MSHLYEPLGPKSDYYDRRSGWSMDEWQERLRLSTTVYVGNLTFYTREDQLFELFGKCGDIDLIVMGLNRKQRNPCGFCFVRFMSHAAAHRAVELLNRSTFDDREIRVDWDSGDGINEESRKFGRGLHGLQWRDEFRTDFDAGRGGEGGGLDFEEYISKRNRKRRHNDVQWERYGNPHGGGGGAGMFGGGEFVGHDSRLQHHHHHHGMIMGMGAEHRHPPLMFRHPPITFGNAPPSGPRM